MNEANIVTEANIVEIPNVENLLSKWKKDVKHLEKTYKNFDGNKKELFDAKKEVNKTIKDVEQVAKDTRAIFNKINKNISEVEKTTLKPITEIYEVLSSKHKEKLEEEKREERKASLPLRVEELKQIDVVVDPEIENLLLSMDEKEYRIYYQEKQTQFTENVRLETERIKREQEQRIRELILNGRRPFLVEIGAYLPDEELVSMTDEEFAKFVQETKEKKARLLEEQIALKEKNNKIRETDRTEDKKVEQVEQVEQKVNKSVLSKAKVFFDKYGVTKSLIDSGEYKLLKDESSSTWTLYKKVDTFQE